MKNFPRQPLARACAGLGLAGALALSTACGEGLSRQPWVEGAGGRADAASPIGADRPDAGAPADAGPSALPATWSLCGELGSGLARLVAHAPRAELGAVAYERGKIAVHLSTTGTTVTTLQASALPVRAMAFDPEGTVFGVAAGDGLEFWTLRDGQRRWRESAPKLRADRLFVTSNNFILAVDLPEPAEGPVEEGVALLMSPAPGGSDFAPVTIRSVAATITDDGHRVTYVEASGAVVNAWVSDDGLAPGWREQLPSVPRHIELSRDGELLAGLEADGRLALWRTRGAVLRWRSEARFTRPKRLAASADWSHFVVVDEAGLTLVRAADGKVVSQMAETVADFSFMATPADGSEGVVILPVGAARLLLPVRWPPEQLGFTLGNIQALPGSSGPITALVPTPGRPELVSGMAIEPQLAGTTMPLLSVWHSETGELVGGREGQSQATLSWDGRHLAGVSTRNGTTTMGLMLTTPRGRQGGAWLWERSGAALGHNYAFSPSADVVAAGGAEGIEILGLERGERRRLLEGARRFQGIAFSPDGQSIGGSAGELWNAADGSRLWPASPVGAPGVPEDATESDNWALFSPDGRHLVVQECWARAGAPQSACTRSTRLLRVSDGALLLDLGPVDGRHPTFSPDGRWLIAGTTLYDVADRLGRSVELALPSKVTMFAKGNKLAVGSPDGVIRLFCPDAAR